MYVFGGHDGTRHLNDVHVFDFNLSVWSVLSCEGIAPTARDSHVAVIHKESMYVFGGSTGTSMNDFHELRLDTCKWSAVNVTQAVRKNSSASAAGEREFTPGHRFCHAGCVDKESMFVFGGYDGTHRLNDFWEFKFGADLTACEIPRSSILEDMATFVNNESLSDITFLIEGVQVHAHRLMLMRCDYFRAMLEGGFKESTEQRVIELNEVSGEGGGAGEQREALDTDEKPTHFQTHVNPGSSGNLPRVPQISLHRLRHRRA